MSSHIGALGGAVRAPAALPVERTERTKPLTAPQETPRPTPDVDKFDREEPPTPAGRYYPVAGEDGSPKIVFERPEAEQAPTAPEKAADAPADSEKAEDARCTVNTDKVDAELRQLKQRQAELAQAVARAADDPARQENLQRQLTQVQKQLQAKGTDTYRRTHATYTDG